MKTELFDYQLQKERIAQTPLLKRSDSKLLTLDKTSGFIKHEKFSSIINYLQAGDCLVINNSKVLPARLFGIKEKTNALIEILLLENQDNLWEALVKPAKRIKVGDVISFGDTLKAVCREKRKAGIALFEMIYEGVFLEILETLGQMPLPPYIHEKLVDKSRYQTIYAKDLGSVAAPTAGFHFTPKLLAEIKEKNIEIIEITLHVGLATFKPIKEKDIKLHKMHQERYYISPKAKKALDQALLNKSRIIAVGTTSLRALEANYNNGFTAGFFKTDLFIYPGFKFRVVKGLITNFHLPKSTLLVLVSAFSKRELILNAYQEAIKYDYRFFSFGDAMFIY